MDGVVWFFERNGVFVRFETPDTARTPVYELVIVDADGTERVERFATSDELHRRQQQLQSTLCAEGWTGPHGRFL